MKTDLYQDAAVNEPIVHKTMLGTDISDACRQMFAKSQLAGGAEVVSEFNGIPLTTKGFFSWMGMADDWWEKANERAKAAKDKEAREAAYAKHQCDCFNDMLAALEKADEWMTEEMEVHTETFKNPALDAVRAAIKKATVTP